MNELCFSNENLYSKVDPGGLVVAVEDIITQLSCFVCYYKVIIRLELTSKANWNLGEKHEK